MQKLPSFPTSLWKDFDAVCFGPKSIFPHQYVKFGSFMCADKHVLHKVCVKWKDVLTLVQLKKNPCMLGYFIISIFFDILEDRLYAWVSKLFATK